MARYATWRSSRSVVSSSLVAVVVGCDFRVLAERLGRPRTIVHKTLTGQRRLDPIEFLDWCEALEFDDPVKLIRSVQRRPTA